MIQISQLFQSKYIDLILLAFVAVVLFVFIYLIIIRFKKKNENSTDNILLKIIHFAVNKIIPIIFGIFLLVMTIMIYVPKLANVIYPPDNLQKITIRGDGKTNAEYLLLGRLTFTDEWRPIFLIKNNLETKQISPIINVNKNETKTFDVRTGVSDMNYLYLCDLKGKKYVDDLNGIVLKSPQNDIFFTVGLFERPLGKKVPISLNFLYVFVATYFVGIISCIWLFMKIQTASIKLKIIYIFGLTIILASCGYSLFCLLTAMVQLI